MRNLNQDNITQAVLARFADTPSPRLHEIMTSLVQHLHAFAREVKLTEDEWFQGIQFLTATGQKCDDKRQEFILLSDVLGLSMLTMAMNNDKPAGCTEATVFGPFYFEGAPDYEHGDDVANGAVGAPCRRVRHGARTRRRAGGQCRWSTCGRPTKAATTTCSTKGWTTQRTAAACALRPMAAAFPQRAGRGLSDPGRWARWATCCARPNATRGGPRICIS